jgi:hypothetical protein
VTAHPALDLVDAVAAQLADPDTAHPRARACVLASAAPRLRPSRHRAPAHRAGRERPGTVAARPRLARRRLPEPFTSGPDSHPFYGAPAFAHALACAADHLPGSYQRALNTMDRQIAADVGRRLDAAHRRIDAGRLPQLAEFDTIRGLTGYGAYLLRRNPGSPTMRSVLDYCVRLTEPITHHGETLPGWWTETGPSGSPDDDDSPAGTPTPAWRTASAACSRSWPSPPATAPRRRTPRSTAHHPGLAGPLAGGDRSRGPTWPYWVTRSELRTGRLAPSAPRRPSWCYGTAGLARAQQLAALALGDTDRQIDAENALVAALTDPDQLKATTDNGLCHGFAGLAHVAARTADDAHPSTVGQLRAAIPALLAAVHPPGTDPKLMATALIQDEERGPGLLDGAAGIALALLAPSTAAPPRSAWDACLLIA